MKNFFKKMYVLLILCFTLHGAQKLPPPPPPAPPANVLLAQIKKLEQEVTRLKQQCAAGKSEVNVQQALVEENELQALKKENEKLKKDLQTQKLIFQSTLGNIQAFWKKEIYNKFINSRRRISIGAPRYTMSLNDAELKKLQDNFELVAYERAGI